MRIAVVDYSRFGHTRVIAQEIAQGMGAELREIRGKKEHSYPVMGLGSLLGMHFQIEPMDLDFSSFDTVVVCTPIWAHRPACPTRTFLRDARLQGRRLIIVFTLAPGGERGEAKALEHIRHELAGKGITIELSVGTVAEGVSEELLRAAGQDLARRIASRLKVPLATGEEVAMPRPAEPRIELLPPEAPPPAV